MSQKAHANPAARDAQRVSAMIPLFCEKVVFGGDVIRHAKNLTTGSLHLPEQGLSTGDIGGAPFHFNTLSSLCSRTSLRMCCTGEHCTKVQTGLAGLAGRVHSVREQAALHARVEVLPLDGDLRRRGGHADVADLRGQWERALAEERVVTEFTFCEPVF